MPMEGAAGPLNFQVKIFYLNLFILLAKNATNPQNSTYGVTWQSWGVWGEG